jgi:GAF domain-containing protein
MITSCLSIPFDEEKRLQALAQYPLDLEIEEQQFERITRMVSMICETPISLISIIDLDKQRFKSKIGIDLKETMRDISFCQYTLHASSVLEIEDAHNHDLFRHNPMVTGDPYIRFYAGAPLITKAGIKLGSLCAIDHVPRRLSDKQLELLSILSNVVVDLFEYKRATRDLQKCIDGKTV